MELPTQRDLRAFPGDVEQDKGVVPALGGEIQAYLLVPEAVPEGRQPSSLALGLHTNRLLIGDGWHHLTECD